jgi:hypothetical protein
MEPLVTEIEMAVLRKELAEGQRVVVDNTNITRELRQPYIELAQEMGKTVGCVFLALPLDYCLANNQARERTIPDQVLAEYYRSMQLPRQTEGMKKRRYSWISTALAGCLLAPAALGWGQPDHAVLGEGTLRAHSSELPPELSDQASRDAFVYGCYSPDGYLFHGPDYVHLDRHYAVLMLKHARDERGRALAYGWAAHMEQDVAGHGRYIKESGLDHLKKELSVGTRIRYQGKRWEKKVIKGLRAIFDVEQVHAASAEYVATHGGGYKVISRRHAKLTGLGYSAYLTALHGVMFANYWGNLKWRKGKYPRSEWQFAFDEALGLTHMWSKDFHSFARSSVAARQRNRFSELQAALDLPPAAPAASPLTLLDGRALRAEVVNAVRELSEERAKAGATPLFAHAGFDAAQGDMPYSHVLVQDPDFYELGARILEADAATLDGETDGSFYAVEPRPQDPRSVLLAMQDALESGALVGLRSMPGERGQFFSELADLTRVALERYDGEEE